MPNGIIRWNGATVGFKVAFFSAKPQQFEQVIHQPGGELNLTPFHKNTFIFLITPRICKTISMTKLKSTLNISHFLNGIFFVQFGGNKGYK